MLSMTGYGKGEYKNGGIELSVEIKTVNNRYLDVSVKAPKLFASCEDVVRSRIREKITRGRLDVFINLTDKREKQKTMYVDLARASAYLQAVGTLKERFPDLLNDVAVGALLKYPDILKEEENGSLDNELLTALYSALDTALLKLNEMRKAEGEKLKKDMLSRMRTIEELVVRISERAPLVVENYRIRLKERMESYLKEIPVDEAKLLNEVAVFADKSNIDEELTRLRSHIAQFRDISECEIVGRQLDFLVQEFNRETNTVCSKSNDLGITQIGLNLKNEIEKVREQVQNLE